MRELLLGVEGRAETGLCVHVLGVEAERLEEGAPRAVRVLLLQGRAPGGDEAPRLGLVALAPVLLLLGALPLELDLVRLGQGRAGVLEVRVERDRDVELVLRRRRVARSEVGLALLEVGARARAERRLLDGRLLGLLLLLEERLVLHVGARVVRRRLGRGGVEVESELEGLSRLAHLLRIPRRVEGRSPAREVVLELGAPRPGVRVGLTVNEVRDRREGERGRPDEREDLPVADRPLARAVEGGRALRRDREPVDEVPDVEPELGGRLVALARVLLDRLEGDRVDLPGEPRAEARGRRRVVEEDLGEDVGHREPLEGEPSARGDLEEHDAERVDVAPRVYVLCAALGLLGGHVGGGAHELALGREARPGARFVEPLRDAEVEDPRRADPVLRAGRVDDHVLRLQVAVDDPARVRVVDGVRHLREEREEPAHGLRRVVEERAERRPLREVHGDVGAALVLAEVVDADDRGVVELGGGLGLAEEAPARHVVLEVPREEDLERERPVELGVARAVDDAHAAARDLLEEHVAPERSERGRRERSRRRGARRRPVGAGAADPGQVTRRLDEVDRRSARSDAERGPGLGELLRDLVRALSGLGRLVEEAVEERAELGREPRRALDHRLLVHAARASARAACTRSR